MSDDLEAVQQALFQTPLLLGHASRVQGQGDWFTHGVSGVGLLVVRGYDDELRGFLNVCRHQGNRVVPADSGCGASGFSCPFHGWTYDTRGRVTGAPSPSDLTGDEEGLISIDLEERHGFVFALPREARVRDIAAWLGAAEERLAPFDEAGLRVHKVIERQRPADWRRALEAFLVPVDDVDTESSALGLHQHFGAGTVGGLLLFPSTVLVDWGDLVSVVSAFPTEEGCAWRHELLVGDDPADPPAQRFVQVQQRLFGIEHGQAPSPSEAPVAAFRHAVNSVLPPGR